MHTFNATDISSYRVLHAAFVGTPNLERSAQFFFQLNGGSVETFKHAALCICARYP